MKNRKNLPLVEGFTLVELLAVIVILGVILVIAVPNVLGIIDNSRKGSLASTANMAANAAKTLVASNPAYVPSGSMRGKIIPWTALNLDNVSKDADGGSYDAANSYVVVVNHNGNFRYFVTIKASKRSVDRKEAGSVTVDNDTTITATVSTQSYTDYGGDTALDITID